MVDLETYCAHTLTAHGHGVSEDGTGRGTPIVPIAGTLSANAGGLERPAGNGNELDFCIPICDVRRGAHADPVAFNAYDSENSSISECATNPLSVGGAEAVQQGWRVRRLTPRECERLMGLPDDYTRYGVDGKEIADGPRYRMLGNGWSVPQAEWLARRILEVGVH